MTLKKFLLSCVSQLRSIMMVALNMFSKRETRLYPEESLSLSSRSRGRIILTCNSDGSERCVACNLCAVVCPVGCIALQKSETQDGRSYPKFFRINFSRCIFCGFCEEACPTMAIQLSADFELSESKRNDLIYEKEDLLIYDYGKNKDYNFYHVSGVSLKNKNIGDLKIESRPIDVKNLLP
ncbi:NADH-quinone oxidoreductase subunit I [Buchnera aphidicola (Eriosoma grossulariae)]|uniref:NADH-quinone oxidoreductase subunit NuoI n=1 Tax=Buchnera aphidicola TaxID=9 RepID=UPI003463964C